MSKTLLPLLLFLFSCGLYNDKFDPEEVTPFPSNKKLFAFPDVAELSWLQYTSNNSASAKVRNSMEIHFRNEMIEEVDALLMIYSGEDRTYEDLVFLEELTFTRTAKFVVFDESRLFDQNAGDLVIIDKVGGTSSPFRGSYSGNFKISNKAKLVGAGVLRGYIDFEGKLFFLFSSGSGIVSLSGYVTPDGSFLYDFRDAEEGNIATGNMHIDVMTNLEVPIADLTTLDTISITLIKKP